MTRIAIRDSTDSYNIDFFDNTNGIKYHLADLEVYAQGSAFLDLKYYSKTQIVDVGMRLAFVFRGKDYWMTVTSVSRESEYEYQVEARSLSLEALREVRSSYKASRNMTFKEYIDVFDPEHSIRLNVNTISDRSRQLEWTGEDTILARILSLATKFDAEIAFETELNDDYSLKEFRLNVHALNELGKDRTGTPFRISNSQLKLIKFKSSIDEFYSAIRGTGKDGLSISGLDKKVYDDEKKLLFYTSGGTIYAPQARDKFISITNKKTSDGYIVREFDNTEHETKEALYAYMLGELKKHCEPQIDYTIDGYIDADVNDTVLLIDDKYTTDDLMLTARVNKQKWSLIDKLQGNNRTELSNYVRVYSEIDERLLKIMDDLVDEKTPYVADILTSNGSQFVNKIGTTTLTPNVVKGLESATGLTFEWFKDGEKIANTANVEVTANDFDSKAVYKYIAYLNNKKVAEKEITLSNVSDGEQGPKGDDGLPGKDGVGLKTTVITYGISDSETIQPTTWNSQVPTLTKGSYLWTRTTWTYTDNTTETGYQKTYIARDGNNGTDGLPGKDGVGISSTTITYATSTSGTVQPTSGWSTTIPSVPSGQYLWTKTTWTYTDGTSETGYSVAKMGETGPQGIQGPRGENGQSLYTWLKYADDANGNGMSETPDGKKYIGLAYNKTVSTESNNPSDYTWSLIQGANGAKGADGITHYTWVKYADTATGGGLSDNPTGKKYIGLAYNKTTPTESTNPSDYTWALIKGDKGEQGDTGNGVSSTVVNYGVSTSGTTQPTSWGTSIPSVPNGQFLWTRTVMNYTNGSSTTFFSVAKMGETGARGTMGIAYLQPTAPTGNIETGSTWFKTVSTTDKRITSIYHYLSGTWVQNQFTQDAINVNSLSALSATLGNVTAGTITGSVFTNDFNRSYTSTLNRTGTTTLADGKLRIDYHDVDKSTGAISANGSYMEYSETGIDFAENDGTATGKRLELNSNRLALGSSNGTFYADPTKVQLSGNGYFQMQPKYFLGSSGDDNFQKMSWTVDGFELRPVDIYGNPRSGNTGIEIAGNNSYVDFKTPYNNGADHDTRIILNEDKSFLIENTVSGKPITFKSYNNLRVFTDNSLIVRNRLDTAWKPVLASGFSQQSDEKWKYNIKDMPSRLEQFKNLDFKAYRLWSESGKYQEGIIANDNIELPFISKGYDGYAVDTYAYATFIGKATQEYIVQTDNTINELKNENIELKNKVNNLESELETIKQQLSPLLNK